MEIARFWIPLVLLGFLCTAGIRPVSAMFYKYRGTDGKLYFVDDLSKVPDQFRGDMKAYAEKYDDLPPEERQRRIEADRRRAMIQQQEQLRRQEAEAREAAELDRQRSLANLQTKVSILGNRVLVPVTIGYGGRTVQAHLLLDTGASHTVLHRDVADALGIHSTREAKARVAGGTTISFEVAQLDFIQVGPFTMDNLPAGIIQHRDLHVDYNGLLGMDFLRQVDYSIDFEHETIQWNPARRLPPAR